MKHSRALTLCMAYYMNAGMLREQLRRLRRLPRAVLDQLEVNIVDDGSPDGDAQGQEIGCPLTIWKIGVDVRWNQDAARNIAAHHATTRWLLLTDIDHLVPVETFERAISKGNDKRTIYRFSRLTYVGQDMHGNDRVTAYKPHPNSWLMTKAMYDHVGGYDERFAGHYGTDAEFRDRAASVARIEMLPQVIWRVGRETIPDASTTTYVRKGAPEDDGAIQRIKFERGQDKAWKPKRLSFPYKQIYP